MREVPAETLLRVNLPSGYHLKEDEDFVYLFRGDEQVSVFSSKGVDPRKIEEVAWNHLHLQDLQGKLF